MPIFYHHRVSPTFSGTVTFPDGSTWTSSGISMASGKQILLASGSVTVPGLGFVAETNTGVFFTGSLIAATVAGTTMLTVGDFDIRLKSTAQLSWSSGDPSAAGADLGLARDAAADTLALKRSTNAQTFNHYGSEITAGTRYSRMAIKHATTSVTAAVGATATATNLIPTKANVLGVNTVVTTGLGVSTGTTGYAVGDGTDPNRWGDIVGTAAGTDTDQTDATADPTGWFNAANSVVLTAAGGNFDGTGVILVDVAYTMTEAA